MENLAALKDAVFAEEKPDRRLEACYADLLENYTDEKGYIFYNLLCLVRKTSRVQEMLKVVDLIRFPVKRPMQKQ